MARIPNMSKVKPIDFNEENYELRRIKNFYSPDKMGIDLSDEKSKKSFIGEIEKTIRKSFEYREMIKFLREHIDMNHCSYFKKVNNSFKGITIEVHHAPFTLYDVTCIVTQAFLDQGIPLKINVIAEQVMLLHFHGLVGLIPVSKTVHELIHSGQIFVPINNVYGDIAEFYSQYWRYMSEDQKEALAKNIKVSDTLAATPPHVLKKKFIYLDVEGQTLPHYVKAVKKKK